MKVERYEIFNQDNISCVGFETKEDALKQCEFMKNYHNMYFYVKKVQYVCVNGEWIDKELVA